MPENEVANQAPDAGPDSVQGGGASPVRGFHGETLVQVPGSCKQIDLLQPGDMVLTRCASTGEEAYRPVLRWSESEPVPVHRVVTRTELGDVDTIVVTPGYRFGVRDRGWVTTTELQCGDVLESKEQVKVWVSKISLAPWKTYAYDIEVEGFNTFFAGNLAVWVRNCTE